MDLNTRTIRGQWTSAIPSGDWPPAAHPDYSRFTDAKLGALSNWADDGRTHAESYSEIIALIGEGAGEVAGRIAGAIAGALLHKSANSQSSPFPGHTYPRAKVTGMPSAVKRFMTAARI